MANYKEIQGFPIQNLSSDPVPYAQELADNPYAGVWSSAASMNTGRFRLGGAGTPSAALAFGGLEPTTSAKTESWNGSAWSEVNDMNTARRSLAGTGIQTSAIQGGGYTTANVDNSETWDGTNWTEVSEINSARRGGAGIGTAVGSLVSGGITTGIQALNESWNGSAWTEVNDLNTARGNLSGTGTTTAGIVIAGDSGPGTSGLTETWNGTSFTEDADLNTARAEQAAAGTQTDALVFGGYSTVYLANTEAWNGTAWTEVNDLATGRATLGGSGPTGSAALAFGGANPSVTAATEEWAFSGLPPSTPAAGYADAITGQMYYNSTTGQFKAIKDGGAPIGTWASGGSTNTEAGQRGGASRNSTTNAFVSGGFRMGVPDVTTNAESYNGTSWTEGPNQPATNRIGAAWGTTISYVTAGGSTGIAGAPINPYAFEWNGTSFSNGGTMNNARRNAAGAGVSETAGRAMAGGDNPGPAQAFNESYDGTSFTEETDINTARIRPIGFGTTTSAIIANGSSGTNVEQWNGSAWTEIAETVVTTSNSAGGAGTTTDGLIFSQSSPTAATTQYWNGSSWTEVAELSVIRYANTGGGAGSTNAISVGGYGPPTAVTTSTEEWTAGDFDITTLTTS